MRQEIDENTSNAFALATEFFEYCPDTCRGIGFQMLREKPRRTPARMTVPMRGKYFAPLVNRMMNLYYPWVCTEYRHRIGEGEWSGPLEMTPMKAIFSSGIPDGFYVFTFTEAEIPEE